MCSIGRSVSVAYLDAGLFQLLAGLLEGFVGNFERGFELPLGLLDFLPLVAHVRLFSDEDADEQSGGNGSAGPHGHAVVYPDDLGRSGLRLLCEGQDAIGEVVDRVDGAQGPHEVLFDFGVVFGFRD